MKGFGSPLGRPASCPYPLQRHTRSCRGEVSLSQSEHVFSSSSVISTGRRYGNSFLNLFSLGTTNGDVIPSFELTKKKSVITEEGGRANRTNDTKRWRLGLRKTLNLEQIFPYVRHTWCGCSERIDKPTLICTRFHLFIHPQSYQQTNTRPFGLASTAASVNHNTVTDPASAEAWGWQPRWTCPCPCRACQAPACPGQRTWDWRVRTGTSSPVSWAFSS